MVELVCVFNKSVGNVVDFCFSFFVCGVLMILEYVEGFSNNKCIEFFNLINGSIDFFDYIVNVYFNGFIIVGCIEDLFGILGVGEIYVICSNCVVNIFI